MVVGGGVFACSDWPIVTHSCTSKLCQALVASRNLVPGQEHIKFIVTDVVRGVYCKAVA